jgi:manganese/iron transport system ATP-binding protein
LLKIVEVAMPLLLPPAATHDADAPTVELNNVTVRFGETVALEQTTLHIQRGDHVAVVGPNGAGKSTLFNLIAGLIKPTSGTVSVYGSGPQGHICVGYVPQRNKIDQRFPVSVADVVMMGRVRKIGLFRRAGRVDHTAVGAALEQVGMQAFAQRQIGELSGGQQQRVFLARALAQEAELLLLDEPLSGLDLPSQEAILQLLSLLRSQGITVLVATHDLNQAAEQFPLVLLLNRRPIAFGPARQVLRPERLAAAYGSQLHVVHAESGDLLLADSCCAGSTPLVELPVVQREKYGIPQVSN